MFRKINNSRGNKTEDKYKSMFTRGAAGCRGGRGARGQNCTLGISQIPEPTFLSNDPQIRDIYLFPVKEYLLSTGVLNNVGLHPTIMKL